MTATKKGCSNEPGPAKATPLNFNTDEIRYLKQSWEMATSTMDIGCELVARLLNDNRTRFRELIESHSGEILGAANITAEDVRKIRRARAVGGGVVIFFNQGIRRPWQKGNVFESLESLGEFFTLFDEAEEINVGTPEKLLMYQPESSEKDLSYVAAGDRNLKSLQDSSICKVIYRAPCGNADSCSQNREINFSILRRSVTLLRKNA
ncbi:hypothetical protein COOONC_12944 [Cooperia oncophora]